MAGALLSLDVLISLLFHYRIDIALNGFSQGMAGCYIGLGPFMQMSFDLRNAISIRLQMATLLQKSEWAGSTTLIECYRVHLSQHGILYAI